MYMYVYVCICVCIRILLGKVLNRRMLESFEETDERIDSDSESMISGNYEQHTYNSYVYT